jgi:hypothetical protein
LSLYCVHVLPCLVLFHNSCTHSLLPFSNYISPWCIPGNPNSSRSMREKQSVYPHMLPSEFIVYRHPPLHDLSSVQGSLEIGEGCTFMVKAFESNTDNIPDSDKPVHWIQDDSVTISEFAKFLGSKFPQVKSMHVKLGNNIIDDDHLFGVMVENPEPVTFVINEDNNVPVNGGESILDGSYRQVKFVSIHQVATAVLVLSLLAVFVEVFLPMLEDNSKDSPDSRFRRSFPGTGRD